MRLLGVVCVLMILFSLPILGASKGARMGAQIGLGVVGGAAGFMVGTTNACCMSCVSFVGDPNIGDLEFVSGTMTVGGLIGTVLGGTAGVYFTGNAMMEEGSEIENPWQTFFGTMAGGVASCGMGYLLDFTMHRVRGDESSRPGSFYLVGLMLSPIAETFAYHQIIKETETSSGGATSLNTAMSNPRIVGFSLRF
jgi:hypothetical protein